MSLLTNGLEKLNIKYSGRMLEQVDCFYEILIEKNKVMNLTSITDKDDFIIKHILDSLLSYEIYKFKNDKIIDIGTGAGFPGLPLKIFFPDLEITLIDSVNKKLNFINEVADKIDLKNIKTIHGRAEDLAKEKDLREKFDIGVSRAVANMSALSELCLPFIKNGGKFIFYKSIGSDDEINAAQKALKILGDCQVEIFNSAIPETDIKRKFVTANKQRSISNIYPRKAGEPNRNPL